MIIDPNISGNLLRKFKLQFFPKVVGKLKVKGIDAAFEPFTQHLPGNFMPLGSYSYSQSFFGPVSKIGRFCSIGSNVTVMGNRHPLDWMSTSPIFYRKKRAQFWNSKREDFPYFDSKGAPIVIENDVWIGDDVTLAHGIRLETGCVVATGSVVTKDVPPYTIVGGVPAKFIRKRFADDTINDLLASNWWRYPVSTWDDHDITSPYEMIDTIGGANFQQEELPENRMTFHALYRKLQKPQ